MLLHVLYCKAAVESCSAMERVVLWQCRHVLLCDGCKDWSLHGGEECGGCRKKKETLKVRLARLKRKSKENGSAGEVFEVEKILDKKSELGKVFYLAKWLGYDDDEENTWEPEENLDCDEELQKFEVKDQVVKQETHVPKLPPGFSCLELAEELLQLLEILQQLPHCSEGERVLLEQSGHLLQCGGCEEAWLHGQGCGRCRPRGVEGSFIIGHVLQTVSLLSNFCLSS